MKRIFDFTGLNVSSLEEAVSLLDRLKEDYRLLKEILVPHGCIARVTKSSLHPRGGGFYHEVRDYGQNSDGLEKELEYHSYTSNDLR